MQEGPDTRGETPGTTTLVPPKPLAENAVLKFFQRPRIMLILLGGWNVVAAVAEFFVDLGGGKIHGPVGGLALSWETIPLAVLYFYAARDPQRHQQVFWLALIQQAAAIAAALYHWGAGDVTAGSIVIPVAVAAALGALVFLHLFQPKPAEAAPPTSPGEPASAR